MQFTAQQIATILEGKVDGNPDALVSQLSKIEEATNGSLSFLSNPKYEHFLYSTHASVVIVNSDLVLQKPVSITLIRVQNAYTAFSKLLDLYQSMKIDKSGREEPCFVDESAIIGGGGYIGAFAYIGKNVELGNNVKIYPHVYIGDNVKIGDNSVLFSGVKIYHDCILGVSSIIHSCTVIGSDGFGFAPQEDGSYKKVPQIGNVIIEDFVEIGANTVIDRATVGSTIIKQGVKLDNLIQIAHNAEIGQNTVVAAQTGISGSTKIGSNVVLGGQVGIVGHITIADKSQVQAQTGINRSIKEPNKKWGGTPVMPYGGQLRSHVVYTKLPELEKRLIDIEKIVKKEGN